MRYPIPELAPGEWHESEIEVEKSRFITWLAHTPSVADFTGSGSTWVTSFSNGALRASILAVLAPKYCRIASQNRFSGFKLVD